jgi:hypothetical protein
MRALRHRIRRSFSRLFPDMADVCRRIDEEIESHLSMAIEDLVAGGGSHAAARATAVERFGDPSAVRAELIAMALRPKRRLTAAAGGTLCVGLSASLLLTSLGNDRNAALAETIADLDAHLRREQARNATVSSVRFLQPAQTVHIVHIEGAVGKARTWTIPRDGKITALQLLARSGVLENEATGRVYLIPFRVDDPVWTIQIDDWSASAESDRIITESCTIMVERRENPPA